MGNWGDDVDYEAMSIKDHKGRFTINFKKIFMDVDEIALKTLEITDKHPKDSLLKLWAGTMTGMFIFFLFSFQILYLVTTPCVAFYLIALFRIAGCWKSFGYSAVKFWGMSVCTIACMFALSRGALFLVDKMI